MRVFVHAKPGAKQEKVTQRAGEHGSIELSVSVKEPSVDEKANNAILKAVATHLGVPRSRVSLVRGLRSRSKVFEVLE